MTKFPKLSMEELDRVSVDEFHNLDKTPIIVVLDNIRSANNVGSFFRTADAFRIEKIILCGITSTPPNKEIQKTALGAYESVEWEYQKDTLSVVEKLKKEGVYTISIEQAHNSISLKDIKSKFYDGKIAVIFGNEVNGVDQEVINQSDSCIEIPQWGTKHSLNVAVSGGIILWHLLNSIQNQGLE
ncbi:MAG: RNA methyltransferase [Salinivirgaceae bacterium]|nr:RNA methyltransferase [Salinivirgaceae bacterium]MDD4745952.1 RNA methyltransferase [Salinivirgaceae bacterium]